MTTTRSTLQPKTITTGEALEEAVLSAGEKSVDKSNATAIQAAEDPVKYEYVFDVRGNLASEPVAPVDAASMQSAESQVLGRTQRGGPAAVMQSAANVNVRAGLVDPDDASEVVRESVTVTETNIGGTRGVTESVGGQVVGQCVDPSIPAAYPRSAYDITIGEALEATAYTAAGEKPIDQSEAAAIKAAELRALRSNETPSSGIGAQA
ncbi:hypothetical protein GH714_025161 [Hevea brasiliensis]|uniref:SMP domain-containing protein n=1 Tax=Hevea brasiliensis TaxID=3981 RepID=A0A6A6NK36_HEVBR|nr:hypothetical protein GH714_025161 [Hevea brasiliensis]